MTDSPQTDTPTLATPMTIRPSRLLSAALVALLAAPAALAGGPGDVPSWAAPVDPPAADAPMAMPPTPTTSSAQVPVDGGLGLLALAGGLYAARRLRTARPEDGEQ